MRSGVSGCSLSEQPSERECPLPNGGGTLVWVGPTDRPECVEAFRYCAERALQIAPRRTLDDLLARPAERVGRVVVVRMDRMAAPNSLLRELDELFPEAEKTLLLGSDCEGEGRTGERWPQFRPVYWHRWNQVVPSWFADRVQAESRRPLRQSVAVIAHSQPLVEGVLDAVAALGHAVTWLPAMVPASVRNIDICLWDDSVAPPTSTSLWRTRLAASTGDTVRQRPRHGWLVGFPRIEDWAAARRAGVEGLISKPFDNRVIHHFIERQLHPIPARPSFKPTPPTL